MGPHLPVLPPEAVWVPLVEALTWMRWRHAVEAADLLATRERLGLTGEELREQLQEAWRELADEAASAGITVRARAEGERREGALNPDDLRNCRFLVLGRGSDTQNAGSSSDHSYGAAELRIERHEDTFSGAWRRMSDEPGSDFSHIFVARTELLKRYPIPAASEGRLKSSIASANAALAWLEETLDRLEPRSATKAELIGEMRSLFRINKARAMANWTHAVARRPVWSLPGPRRGRRSNSPIESE
jgi:hypothetical protein